MAACAVMITGLVILTLLVLVGWIAAPHAGLGLPGVLRTAAGLWLVGAPRRLRAARRRAGSACCPLGLVLLPGALLWRAGRWVVRTGQVVRLLRGRVRGARARRCPTRCSAGALALASRSPLAAPSLPQAVAAGFLIALVRGRAGRRTGTGALGPPGTACCRPGPVRSCSAPPGHWPCSGWRARSWLAPRWRRTFLSSCRLNAALGAGAVGSVLLLLIQIAYVPNAVVWAVCFTLGPGFAFGTGTVVAPTGSALGPLPMFPMLAALPAGAHASVPGWASAAVLAVPYLAGCVRRRAAGAGGADAGDRGGPAVGVRLRRGHRVRHRGAGGLLRRPAGQRAAGRGGTVRVAGRPGRHPGGRGRRRGGRGRRELAAASP